MDHTYLLGLDLDEVLEGADPAPAENVSEREAQCVELAPLTDRERWLVVREFLKETLVTDQVFHGRYRKHNKRKHNKRKHDLIGAMISDG